MKLTITRPILLILATLTTMGGWAQVTIGSDHYPTDGVLLDLKEWESTTYDKSTSDKGVLLPRVRLENLHSLQPLSSDPSKNSEHKGTIVYNVSQENNLKEGMYYWNGTEWAAMVPDIPPTSTGSVQLVELKETVISRGVSGTNYSDGNELTFSSSLLVPEDGAYAFSFRFYGEIRGIGTIQRTEFYLSLWNKNTLMDISQMVLYVAEYDNMNQYTYSVTMAGNFKKGDTPRFKLANISGKPDWALYRKDPDKLNANRSSMVWWKM